MIPVALRRWRRRPARRRRGARSPRSAASCGATNTRPCSTCRSRSKGALIARIARGARHGPDRASIREPVATLAHDVASRDRSRPAPDRSLPPARRRRARLSARRPAALRNRRATATRRRGARRRSLRRLPARDEPRRQAVARSELACADRRGSRTPASPSCCPWGSAAERARSERLAAGQPSARVPPLAVAGSARRACWRVPNSSSASTPGSCTSPRRSARRRWRCSSRPTRGSPASNARAAPRATWAGSVACPPVDEVADAAGALLRRVPRC